MADSTTATASRLTRKQAILLGVLGTGLIAALIFQPPKENGHGSDESAAVESTRPRRSSAPTKTADWTPHWPTIPFSQMLQQNPFDRINISIEEPASVEPKPVATAPVDVATDKTGSKTDDDDQAERRRKSEEALTAFQRQKVKLTFRSGDKASALIGDRLVHEGEIIDGLRIVSIMPTGVLVESIHAEP